MIEPFKTVEEGEAFFKNLCMMYNSFPVFPGIYTFRMDSNILTNEHWFGLFKDGLPMIIKKYSRLPSQLTGLNQFFWFFQLFALSKGNSVEEFKNKLKGMTEENIKKQWIDETHIMD